MGNAMILGGIAVSVYGLSLHHAPLPVARNKGVLDESARQAFSALASDQPWLSWTAYGILLTVFGIVVLSLPRRHP